eukprot:Rmarinus@m.7778
MLHRKETDLHKTRQERDAFEKELREAKRTCRAAKDEMMEIESVLTGLKTQYQSLDETYKKEKTIFDERQRKYQQLTDDYIQVKSDLDNLVLERDVTGGKLEDMLKDHRAALSKLKREHTSFLETEKNRVGRDVEIIVRDVLAALHIACKFTIPSNGPDGVQEESKSLSEETTTALQRLSPSLPAYVSSEIARALRTKRLSLIRAVEEQQLAVTDLTQQITLKERTAKGLQDEIDNLQQQLRDANARAHNKTAGRQQLESVVARLRHVEEATEPLVTCLKCLSLFQDPVTCVPCGHSYCRKCANELRESAGNSYFCGECGRAERVDYLFTNETIDQLASKYEYRLQCLAELGDLAKKISS